MKTNRFAMVAGIGTVLGALLVASNAWACSPTFNLKSGAAAGPAGSEVTVSGTAYSSDAGRGNVGPVEIRWNSITGTRMGSAAGPSFAVAVSIPAVKSGFYSIVSLQRSTDTGEIVGKASTPFEVTAPAPAQPASAPPTPPASSDTSAQRDPSADVEEQGGSDGPAAPSPASPQTSDTTATEAGAVRAPDTGATPSATPAQTEVRSPSTAGSSPRRTPSADVVPRSVAAVVAADGPEATAARGAPLSPQLPPEPTAAERIWQAAPQRVGSSASPPDLSSLLDPPTSGGTSPSLAIGVGLFSVGLISVLASFLVVLVRRHRAEVEVSP